LSGAYHHPRWTNMALTGWPKLLMAAYAGEKDEVESILIAKVPTNKLASAARSQPKMRCSWKKCS
jgi:hypothetical protein